MRRQKIYSENILLATLLHGRHSSERKGDIYPPTHKYGLCQMVKLIVLYMCEGMWHPLRIIADFSVAILWPLNSMPLWGFNLKRTPDSRRYKCLIFSIQPKQTQMELWVLISIETEIFKFEWSYMHRLATYYVSNVQI